MHAKEMDITLSVCRKASILIPGRRLWRSAVVTLGAQRADRIWVLPDMKGIVAEFESVELPGGLTDLNKTDFALPVSVWTSQGRSEMPEWVKVVVPGGSKGDIGGYLTKQGRCPGDESTLVAGVK